MMLSPSLLVILAAALLMLAMALALPASSARLLGRRRSRWGRAVPGSRRSRSGGLASLADPRALRIIFAVAGAGTAVVVGGVAGITAGITFAIAGPYVISRLEPRAARRRREEIQRQASGAADLLAACLASGAPVTHAVEAVAQAMGPPIAQPLRGVVASLELGADPADAWRSLADEPGLGALGRAVARSAESGAPLATLLPGIADDVRRADRIRAETAARAAGVRAVGPLAACFLPAFLLLGVVPIVVSLALPLLAEGVGG